MKRMAGLLLSPERAFSLEEDSVHKALLAVALVLVASEVAQAQGVDVHNRYGDSGTHFQLPVGTPAYNYEATVVGATSSYKFVLTVYHNGILKESHEVFVLVPPPVYHFSQMVGLSAWGLKAGDVITFEAKVVDLNFGNTLDVDFLFGDVIL